MKNWLNQRKNQVSILLTAISIIAVSNVILPSYETLSYFRKKSASLEREYQQLFSYSLHVEYHEKQFPQLQQQLSRLQQLYSNQRNTTLLQNRLGAMQREYQLKTETQDITREKLSQDLEAIRIRQTLVGSYHNLLKYLKASVETGDNVLLERCDLESRDPLDANPALTARLQFTLFLSSQ